MGIGQDIMESGSWDAALAALSWQWDLGVTEFVLDEPLNRYDLAEPAPKAAVARGQDGRGLGGDTGVVVPQKRGAMAPPPEPAAAPDAALVARRAAEGAQTLEQLRAAIAAFDLCDLKPGARKMVFADGRPDARVMIIGEAPGKDEDVEGRPFVGRAGQLLDRMFAAIGLGRGASEAANALYITNVLPWRPPSNREPTPDEVAMMKPFLERHIALADPAVIVVMGNTPASAVLGQKGITRLRGQWQVAYGRPVLPMAHPAYLLRNPAAKREAWADLLALQARLRG